MGNFRKDKPAFLERLKKVVPLLDNHYVPVVKYVSPELSHLPPYRFYTVVSGASVNWDILKALEKAYIKEKN